MEVRPRLEIRMVSKFLIMQKSVQAIWQGQNKDNQVETKDRFVVVSYMADFNKATVALWCSCNGCFALLSSAIWQIQESNCCKVFLLVIDAVMCCCSEEHLKSTKLVYFAETLNDIFGEVHP